MEIKKFLSGLVASTMILSSVPQTLVGAENKNEEKQNQKEEESEKSTNTAVDFSTSNLKEVETQRTEFSKTYEDGNGQLYKEIYAEPVHEKNGKVYEEIDNTMSINQNDQESFKTENTSLTAEFPKNLKNDTGIVFKRGKHSVEFEITKASQNDKIITPNLSSKTTINENQLQYNDIYPEVDLRHVTFNEEVKEDWIIKKYTGINQFSYTLRTKLKPVLRENGSIDFLERIDDTKSVFTLPAPEMMDSNIDEKKGEGTYSKQLRYLLKENTNGTYNLILDIDKEWLASTDRKYPIYVDPSVSIDALGDAYISSKAPTTNFNEKWDPVQGEYVLQTGYYDSTSGTNYAFIKFSVANELKGAVIDSASLQAYVTHAYYATQKNGLWVDEANSKWAINEINWNNKPSSTKISSTLVGRDEWAKLDVKNTLQAWVSEERPNTGFKLHTNGNGQTYWKKITASESANKPKLVIAYHYDQMPTPTMSAQLDNATAKTGSVNVNWKSVFGASSYKLQMFDGYRYETIYTGSALNWTSKDKKMFPKAPFSSSSRYKLDGTGTELPVDPSAFYSANLGSTTTAKAYKFRVIPVYPTGDGPSSTIISKEIPVPAGEPDLPTVTTGTYSEADTINKGRGWLNVKWNKVANATGYKVRIWNGSVYKNYTVGKDTTSISTKGKKIWPTDDQIRSGVTDLYNVNFDDTASIAKGAELPIDPSTTYGDSIKRYKVRIIAISAAGDSPSSDINYGYMKLYAPKNVSITANEDNLVQNKTSLTMNWSPSAGANYYEVQLNNGGTIEKFKVKDATSFTTPKATYALGKQYSANVVAFFDDDDTAYESEEDKVSGQRGLSDKSNTFTFSPSLRDDLNGSENYFTFDEQKLGKASSSVNVTTGNLLLQFADETLYTRSEMLFDLIRSYNSRSEKVSAFGKGWSYQGNESLIEVSNGNVLYEDEDGTTHTFVKEGEQYKSPKGLYQKLSKSSNTFTMTDKYKNSQKFIYNSITKSFLLSSYRDKLNNELRFDRNDKGQLLKIYEVGKSNIQPDISFSYTNDLISKVQYSDHWITYSYSGKNLVQTITGSDKSSRTITENYEYDSEGNLVKYIDGKNNETAIKYNENEIVIFDKQAKDAELSVTKTYQFNSKNNEYTATDSNDNITTYKRDLSNNSYSVSEVNTPGDDEQNTKNSYSYDSNYNLIESINPDSTKVTNTYDSQGNVLTVNEDGGTTTNIYNSDNDLVKSTDKNGEITTNVYENGLLKETTVGNETTKYDYDQLGRVVRTTFANQTFEQTSYNDDELKISTIDKKGNTSSVAYSVFGQEIKEVDAEGYEKSYTYDPLYPEILTSITDGNGNKTNYAYDNNNNLTLLTDALGRNKSYTYNDNDQVTKVSIPNMTYQYEYDQNGEMSKTTLPSGIVKDYSYNVDGQLNQVSMGNSKVDYQYDDFGNVTNILKNDKIIKQFGYSTENNFLNQYKLFGFTQDYKYDSNSRLNDTNVTYNNEVSVNKKLNFKENSDEIASIKYSVDNNLIHDYLNKIDVENGQSIFALSDNSFARTTTLNDINQVKTIAYTGALQSPYLFSYEYTKNGNVSKEILGSESYLYEYDANEQLISELLPNGSKNSYVYDAVGNRTESKINNQLTKYLYNESNQIIKKNNTDYKYDKDGNLILDEKFIYTYNAQQELTQVQQLDGKVLASYTYDDNGIRLSKTVGNTSYEYFYSENKLTMEVVKVDNVIKTYKYYEWNDFVPTGMIIKSKNNDSFTTSAYQFITNHRGDVLRIVDKNGNQVGSYQYDSYGNVLDLKGQIASENPIRYAGYYHDNETGLYYLQARYYNPINGTFMALDPHPGNDEVPLSQNGYNYANNNPVMNIDPTGEKAWSKYAKGVLKRAIKWIFNDFIKNTLTNVFFIAGGAGAGGWFARKAAQSGLKYLPRHIGRKTVKGFIVGGLTAYVLGKPFKASLGVIQYILGKVTDYEGWFDRTGPGKAIDNALRRARDYLVRQI